MSSYSEVSITVDDSDPRDPLARCDQCGAQGTVARAVHHSDPEEIFRYCAGCWPSAEEALAQRQAEEQDEYKKAWRAWTTEARREPNRAKPTPPAGWSSSSRSWHDVQRFLGMIEEGLKGRLEEAASQLTQVAAEIQDKAAEMTGPMPPDVTAFLAKYLPPSK